MSLIETRKERSLKKELKQRTCIKYAKVRIPMSLIAKSDGYPDLFIGRRPYISGLIDLLCVS